MLSRLDQVSFWFEADMTASGLFLFQGFPPTEDRTWASQDSNRICKPAGANRRTNFNAAESHLFGKWVCKDVKLVRILFRDVFLLLVRATSLGSLLVERQFRYVAQSFCQPEPRVVELIRLK